MIVFCGCNGHINTDIPQIMPGLGSQSSDIKWNRCQPETCLCSNVYTAGMSYLDMQYFLCHSSKFVSAGHLLKGNYVLVHFMCTLLFILHLESLFYYILGKGWLWEMSFVIIAYGQLLGF